MSDKPLMPLATAVWLIENTSLSFEQIADFCLLHPLQVKGIADGDVAAGVRGINPITNNQLTREELDKAQADPDFRMIVTSRPSHDRCRSSNASFSPATNPWADAARKLFRPNITFCGR